MLGLWTDRERDLAQLQCARCFTRDKRTRRVRRSTLGLRPRSPYPDLLIQEIHGFPTEAEDFTGTKSREYGNQDNRSLCQLQFVETAFATAGGTTVSWVFPSRPLPLKLTLATGFSARGISLFLSRTPGRDGPSLLTSAAIREPSSFLVP